MLPEIGISKRRAALEISVGYALILLIIWLPHQYHKGINAAPAVWILGCMWLSFDGWARLGLRGKNFVRTLWITGGALVLALAAVAVAIHYGTYHAPSTAFVFLRVYWGYPPECLAQQILLQGFFLRRSLRFMPSTWSAVALSAVLFAAAHSPNPVLVPITLIWAVCSCFLFLRYENILNLSLAHAIIGVCIAITVPNHYTHHMRVGLGYVQYQDSSDRFIEFRRTLE